jgi:hypothetical protein
VRLSLHERGVYHAPRSVVVLGALPGRFVVPLGVAVQPQAAVGEIAVLGKLVIQALRMNTKKKIRNEQNEK